MLAHADRGVTEFHVTGQIAVAVILGRTRANTGAKIFPYGRLFDISVDTILGYVEKYISLRTKEKVKNHDSYKRQHLSRKLDSKDSK